MKNSILHYASRVLILGFLACFSITMQAQLVDVDFSTDPFVNGVTTTYNPNPVNCEGYVLGDNLNSVCPIQAYNADLDALTPANSPMCMSINEPDNNLLRVLYQDNGLVIPAGSYTFCLVAAHRYNSANSGDPVNFNLVIGNNNPVVMNLPYDNTQWTNFTFTVNIPFNTSGFSITVPNAQWESDYAVDLIQLKSNCTPSIEITDIEDRWCIKDEVVMCGTFEDCNDYQIIDVDFFLDGDYIATVHPNEVDFANGTWCYTSPDADELLALGLEPGVFYDAIPTLNLSNSPPVVGDDLQNGLDNDFRLEGETEASVIFNHELTDLTTDLRTYCFGDPIFFHGMAEQSNRYHVAVRSRPIGSNESFNGNGSWQGGQEYGDFDGASWDLTTKYNFPAGFEYQITFGVADTDNCIKWTPVVELLKVIDCCEAVGYIFNSPSCSDAGNIFTVDVTVFAPISEESIDLVYSTSAPFDVLDWSYSIDENTGFVVLSVTVITNYCTCDGEMLKIDIRTECEEVIWVMTPPIPCCESNCDGIDFKGAEVDPSCLIVNGNKAFEFEAYLNIASFINVNNITAEGTGGICPSDVSGIQFSQSGSDVIITGFVEVLNPTCEWADIVIRIDTDQGCCEIVIPFSLPWNCDDECLEGAPTIDNIIEGGKGENQITVSVPGDKGTPIMIVNNLTGQTTMQTIGSVECGPFSTDKYGNYGGVDCTGFTLTAEYDCDDEGEGAASSLYNYTLTIGDCVYHLIGDYCDITPVSGPLEPHDDNPGEVIGGGKFDDDNGGIEVRESGTEVTSFQSKVFPNPITVGQELTISSNKEIQSVIISNVQGKVLYSLTLEYPTSEFVISNLDVMTNGLFIVQLFSTDNDVEVTKLSIVNR